MKGNGLIDPITQVVTYGIQGYGLGILTPMEVKELNPLVYNITDLIRNYHTLFASFVRELLIKKITEFSYGVDFLDFTKNIN